MRTSSQGRTRRGAPPLPGSPRRRTVSPGAAAFSCRSTGPFSLEDASSGRAAGPPHFVLVLGAEAGTPDDVVFADRRPPEHVLASIQFACGAPYDARAIGAAAC